MSTGDISTPEIVPEDEEDELVITPASVRKPVKKPSSVSELAGQLLPEQPKKEPAKPANKPVALSVQEEDAEKLGEMLRSRYEEDDIEVEVHSGGQPIYYYIVSVE